MIHSGKRRLAAACCAALFIALTAVASGGVPPNSVPTTLTMRNASPAFHGKVKSALEVCESDRRVKLFKERRDGSREVLGRTDSDFNGKWLVLIDPLESGSYIAKAKRHIVSVSDRAAGFGGEVVCEPDFGPRIVVD